MTETITRKHLKRQFEIFEETEELDNLFNELQFLNLLLPIYTDGNSVSFPLLPLEDGKLNPVFRILIGGIECH